MQLRVPPQNLEAEQCVLGSMMVGGAESIIAAAERVSAKDFYRPGHAEVFLALLAIEERNEPVDLITVQEELRNRQKLEDAGGTEYLMRLIEVVPTASHLEYYAKIVKDKSVRRALIAAAGEVQELAASEEMKTEDAISRSLSAVHRVTNETKSRREFSLQETLNTIFQRSEEAYRNGVIWSGLRTGLTGIDRMTCGFPRGGLTIIGARPSHGKTALMCQTATENWKGEKTPISIFSLETPREQFIRRMIASRAGVSVQRIKQGLLEQHEWDRYVDAINWMHQQPFILHDDVPFDVPKIRYRTMRDIAEKGVKAIFIDYLQLIQPDRSIQTRRDQLGDIVYSLKTFAQEQDIDVILGSQLSRDCEKEKRLPRMSDFYESGQIEAAVDLAFLLHNPKPEEDDGSPRKATIIVAKQKDGPTGNVPVFWSGSRMTFYDADDYSSEE